MRYINTSDPKFEILGTPSSLLNITLPSSSTLNSRLGSIIASNGQISNIKTDIKTVKFVKPFIYQSISSSTPISLLVSTNELNNNLINIVINKDDKWVIRDKDHVVCWEGYNLSLEQSFQFINYKNDKLTNFNGLQTSGEGQLVLCGKGQLFSVELGQDETILLNPGSLIAHSYSGENAVFTRLKTDYLFNVPEFNWLGKTGVYFDKYYTSLKNAIQPKKEPETEEKVIVKEENKEESEPSMLSRYLTRSYDYVKYKFNVYFKNEIFYVVKGPIKLIINSQVSGNSSNFTREELTKIHEALK